MDLETDEDTEVEGRVRERGESEGSAVGSQAAPAEPAQGSDCKREYQEAQGPEPGFVLKGFDGIGTEGRRRDPSEGLPGCEDEPDRGDAAGENHQSVNERKVSSVRNGHDSGQ